MDELAWDMVKVGNGLAADPRCRPGELVQVGEPGHLLQQHAGSARGGHKYFTPVACEW